MKGYSLESNNKDKVLNEYNKDYGINLKNEETNYFKEYFKPKSNKLNILNKKR